MKFLFSGIVAAVGTNAFPNAFSDALLMQRDAAQPGCSVSSLCDAPIAVSDAQAHIPPTPNAAMKASAARNNCGVLHLCQHFDAKEQEVSVTGAHAYQSPSASDLRGPCPGLNAAANHGYIPRSGMVHIADAITGLEAAYGMSPELAGLLAADAVALLGNPLTQTWPIGGPIPGQIQLPGPLSQGYGLSYSHNNYEGDTSISRCDAYTNGGDAHSSSMTRFAYAYEAGMDNDRYTMDKFARLLAKNTHRSIQSNAYYFAQLFSTTVVAPAAYNFVITFMSNHSAADPAGYLDGETFKSFFGVTGTYPNFTWKPGQERIPDNWYRRPSTEPYSTADLLADEAVEFAAYPDAFRFGGNINGVDSYVGIDIANYSNGAYHIDTLFQGNNLACFFYQNQLQVIPRQLQSILGNLAPKGIQLVLDHIPAYFKSLTCPSPQTFNASAFNPFPGAFYLPTAPTTGPVNC